MGHKCNYKRKSKRDFIEGVVLLNQLLCTSAHGLRLKKPKHKSTKTFKGGEILSINFAVGMHELGHINTAWDFKEQKLCYKEKSLNAPSSKYFSDSDLCFYIPSAHNREQGTATKKY